MTMGLWTSHRQRQAGKYAKASYRLAVARETERRRAWDEALGIIRSRPTLTVEVEVANRRALPPRPDVD
jgi:hypothetical protein